MFGPLEDLELGIKVMIHKSSQIIRTTPKKYSNPKMNPIDNMSMANISDSFPILSSLRT